MQVTNKLAIYSVLSKMIKVLSGPLSLFFVAKYLNEAEIAIYYTFISIVMMQQLLEIGVGSVILQHIAHVTEYDGNKLTLLSNMKVSKLMNFTFSWFLIVAVLIILLVWPIGVLFFTSIDGAQGVWEKPWFCLILVTSLSVYLTPIRIFTEAVQKQEKLFLSQLISSIISSLTLWGSLYFELGLYGISLSAISALLVLNTLIFKCFSRELDVFDTISINIENFLEVFKWVWPLLKNVSLVWLFGYFFWNSFNLFAVQRLDLKVAGGLLFTIAIARTGYQVASSLMNSQIARISWLVAEKKYKEAFKLHRKFLVLTIISALSGYGLVTFFIRHELFSVVTDKLLPWNESALIFLFYTLVLIMASSNQLSRCYKIEPYVKVSILNSLVVVIAANFLLEISFSLTFIILSIYILLAIVICWTIDRRLNLSPKKKLCHNKPL